MMRISLRTCCCYDICHDSSPFKRISQTMMRISLRTCCCYDIWYSPWGEFLMMRISQRTCCCYDIWHDNSPLREFLKQWWEYH